MKIRPVEAQLFHANRRTDMKKLIIACRNFANSPPPPPKKKPRVHKPRRKVAVVNIYIYIYIYGGALYFWFFSKQADSCHASWRLEFCASSKVPTKFADLLANTPAHFANATDLAVSVYDLKISWSWLFAFQLHCKFQATEGKYFPVYIEAHPITLDYLPEQMWQDGLGRPGIESQWVVRISAPVHTGPGAQPTSYTMGTESFPGVTNHSQLAPRLKEE